MKSSRGPEAGVWVIAETTELQTPFVKIVVTGDDGRYVLPQLPTATYNVWVRGYGLVDSQRVEGRPGDTALDLTAVLASTPAEAAKVYPGDYWLSLLQPPSKSEFPGTGASGNGIPPDLKVQGQWIHNIKSSCNFCHQLGNEITRSLGHMDHLGFKTPEEAWIYRTQLGVRGSAMAGAFAVFGVQAGAKVFADWTTRVAGGELPPQPPRPAASSATSWSRCGIGGPINRSCTTRSRPTRTIRPSTATVRSTRSPPATAGSRCSTRSPTARTKSRSRRVRIRAW